MLGFVTRTAMIFNPGAHLSMSCCSAAATFLLRELGFNARWLEGGVPGALTIHHD